MRWKRDLVRDIRTHTTKDDQDAPWDSDVFENNWRSHAEVTDCNFAVLESKFLAIKDKAKAVLEIGISRNGENSFTQAFLRNKLDDTIYVGIDLDDKTYLDNSDKNIFTIRNTSTDVAGNLAKIRELGVDKFDFIFIDGFHSINQVLIDWEYTELLSDSGVVGIHDINHHPGPKEFIAAVDTNLWRVEKYCPNDWGVGFLFKAK